MLILEWIVLKLTPTYPVTRAIMVAVIGAILAGFGDLSYDPLGYLLAFVVGG